MNDSLVAALLVIALVLGASGLVLGLVAVRRTTGNARRLARRNPAALPADLPGLREEVQTLRGEVAGAVRHLGVVRYDAFGDVGGGLSWSVAMLDERGNGVVLTSIHGRSEARTYAKSVSGWAGEQAMSPEEQQAVSIARKG